ncbi:hypothetical protein [Micromonospora sp. LOL_024]|uniref:hypothetical protein n=1 Tax=Micromonospora sp. LOL_024 TaxID=3345412 RepID=UPI003A85DB7B
MTTPLDPRVAAAVQAVVDNPVMYAQRAAWAAQEGVTLPPPAAGPGAAPEAAPTTLAPVQYGDDWLKTASPEQIADAHQAGNLHALMAGSPPPGAGVPAAGQLGNEHVAAMSTEQIADAHQAGRFSALLDGSAPGQG